MTDEQFRMKADQIAVSRKTMEQKAEEMAALLKTAYDENLKMVILYQDKGESTHHCIPESG